MMNVNLGILLLSFAFLFSASVRAQVSGCMDMNANNYSPSATLNDGSCVYATTNYSPILITNLVVEMDESSALIEIDGGIWTLNDSGNSAAIYQLDTLNGDVLRTVYISNAPNHDWEAMAQNNTHIFLGDFGNNSGARQNLRVLKISKSHLNITTNDSLQAEIIRFIYPEQTNFTGGNNNTDFDCEAFFFSNDSLHLFTKNWVNAQTSHYVIPADSGSYNARLAETFNVNGLITDASIDTTNGHIVLLGYKNIGLNVYLSFSWLLSDYAGTQYFSGNKRKIELGNALQLGQTEGIHLYADNTGFISAESIFSSSLGIDQPAKLHRFNFNPYFPRYTQPGLSIFEQKEEQQIVYPNPTNHFFTFKSPYDADIKYTLYNTLGEAVMNGLMYFGDNMLNIGFLKNGSYYLLLEDEKHNNTIVVIKN
jgi:hypothetical protein